ncbi:transcription elongation factor GreA [Candidatus Beckwithbacteria bacterium CG10_big_fil_rev_8_21_14_0_10_34_10]|uniref:Transcription elongation factor GreA n=1 Tax=Candidatus Beckwithbacteria bacterium CG10_big_fil_rev_8_21_14_0_10_34_10 TaxID=1974495 RepID=A0A2H0W9C9_9BACT|nr:MAG: transcription elongation factor GreA [Candidatus Beckwithbacteria bacterium CG10_big_fil_rev_8_21_14_0_10_34_10]
MTVKDKSVYLTKEGLVEIKKELGELEEKKRPRLIKRVALARSMGDLSENSEYTAARDDLSMVVGRIEELRLILSKVKLIKKAKTKGKKQVDLGCKVTVKQGRNTQVFEVVGEWEADPLNKRISHSSPLGKALLGKGIGDQVEIEAPAGKINYLIQKID